MAVVTMVMQIEEASAMEAVIVVMQRRRKLSDFSSNWLCRKKKTHHKRSLWSCRERKKSSVTAVQSSKRQSETGKPVAATGLCHLELPVLITYCVKLQSFECPDLLCFSCSRECAWHWVAELQSPSFSTMSPQVIVLPLLVCPLC